MPKRHRLDHLPLAPALEPTRPIPDVSIESQRAKMVELREAQNGIADRFEQRDRLMQAWAGSNTLSRHDMAAATGLAKSRVDQLIRELTERDMAMATAAGRALVARHSPVG